MKDTIKRSILRWIHIIFAIPIAGYVYSPLKNFQTTPRLFGLSRSLSLSCRDFGCGKAISFADLFRQDRPKKMPPEERLAALRSDELMEHR
jgi:hypothetical protein